MGNIIAGLAVFGLMGAVIFRLIRRARKGSSGCSCGSGCSRCGKGP
ncbi:MAG: FeoB-associated Cys-rich membrane protein [Spirochaetaceae bacterium]|nr:FeoB-associated Cys-rich membrane protein [Spirochaetaceae bacterium]